MKDLSRYGKPCSPPAASQTCVRSASAAAAGSPADAIERDAANSAEAR